MTVSLAGFYADSDAAVVATLKRMRELTRHALMSRDFVWWARQIVQGAPAHDQRATALAVRRYVAHAIKFLRDPVGIENLTDPLEHMLRLQAAPDGCVRGDCDDAATLSAALGMAVGLPATFTVLAFRSPDAPYQHVFTTLYPGGKPVDMDTTRAAQQLPPKATRSHTEPV